MPFTEEDIQHITKAATPDALAPAPPEVPEVAQRIADAALDAYTKEDWQHVLNALRPERAATYIYSRPAQERPELLSLIEPPRRRATVERHLVVSAA